jgi:hypothetical protein
MGTTMNKNFGDYLLDASKIIHYRCHVNELRVEVSLTDGIIPAIPGSFNFRFTLGPEATIEEIKGN